MTLYTLAMATYWRGGEIDVEHLLALLSSDELPELWAACRSDSDVGISRERTADWNRLGEFLAKELAVGGSLQQKLDRLSVSSGGGSVQERIDWQRFVLSGDAESLRCYAHLFRLLSTALSIVEHPGWREDAIRSLVEAATHEDVDVRSAACRSEETSSLLRCSQHPHSASPDGLQQLREALGMAANPARAGRENDFRIRPERHLFPRSVAESLRIVASGEAEWAVEYCMEYMLMAGYAPEMGTDGRPRAVPIHVDAPIIELVSP